LRLGLTGAASAYVILFVPGPPRRVTFGASDMPLEPKDLTASGLIQFPTVVGGDVPVVNLDGVGPIDLVLDGPTLASILLGKITKWDDPAIQKLNPNAKLPSNAIVVVHRSDGSGTPFIFTDYLSKVSPDWKSNVGASTSVEWPVGIGAKGNEGVANNVAQTKGNLTTGAYRPALGTAAMRGEALQFVTRTNFSGDRSGSGQTGPCCGGSPGSHESADRGTAYLPLC
jgi:phosphate ABC transporter phosphate-binding protein